MRDRVRQLAWRLAAGGLDADPRAVVHLDRGQQVTDPADLEFGEQLEHRERRVEVDIDRVVERVVDAFEEREPPSVVR